MATNDRLLVQILLLGLLAASLWVLAPFWSALFWAAVLAFASWPLIAATMPTVSWQERVRM